MTKRKKTSSRTAKKIATLTEANAHLTRELQNSQSTNKSFFNDSRRNATRADAYREAMPILTNQYTMSAGDKKTQLF